MFSVDTVEQVDAAGRILCKLLAPEVKKYIPPDQLKLAAMAADGLRGDFMLCRAFDKKTGTFVDR